MTWCAVATEGEGVIRRILLTVVTSGVLASGLVAPLGSTAPAVAARTVPSGWIVSWSEKVATTAQVNRTVSISPTVLTRRARARGAQVRYRWYVGTQRTSATGRSFRIPRAALGRRISVRVTVERSRMRSRSLTLGFGAVRGTPQDAVLVQEARERVLADLNAVRARRGLAPVSGMDAMTTIAQRWTVRMASTMTMGHNMQVFDQLPDGWKAAGENVAAGPEPASVVDTWMSSERHRDIALGSYNRVGVGVARDDRGGYWYTLDLARY